MKIINLFDRFRKIVWIIVFGMVISGVEGCRRGPSTTKLNNKKIKKGRPIPCPIKDC